MSLEEQIRGSSRASVVNIYIAIAPSQMITRREFTLPFHGPDDEVKHAHQFNDFKDLPV